MDTKVEVKFEYDTNNHTHSGYKLDTKVEVMFEDDGEYFCELKTEKGCMEDKDN